MTANTTSEMVQNSISKLDRYAAMLRVDPANRNLYREAADLALTLRQYDRLAELAGSLLAAQPDDAVAILDLSNAQIGRGDLRAALQTLTGIDEVSARDPAVHSNQGLAHWRLGEYEEARPHLEYCYQQGPKSAGLLRLLVTTYHHLGMLDEAVEVAAANGEPAEADGALAGAYALLYLDADDTANAARWARTTLRIDPKSIDGRVTEGTLLTARMQADRARQMLESVLEDAPDTGRAWIGLGMLSMLAQDVGRAIGLLSRGLELMPGHVGSWHALGWMQMLSGDLSGAERTFGHALEMDRNFAESHGGLASVAALRGERNHAEHLIEIALRLDSECMSAQFARSMLVRQGGSRDQAQQIVDDAIDRLAGKGGSALSKLLARSRKH